MLRSARLLVLAISFLALRPARGTDWFQWGFDVRHSGVNDQETTIHAGNVGGDDLSGHGGPSHTGGELRGLRNSTRARSDDGQLPVVGLDGRGRHPL